MAAKAVLDSGRLTMGERVAQFEQAFAEYVGARHALMVNSGSSANLLMLDAQLRRTSDTACLTPGDEILVPGLSWPTTVWPIVQHGFVPVFVDVDPHTLALDLDSAAAALGPRTKAMFLIHVLGRAPDMVPYLAFCRKHDLRLFEDTCEALGAHSGGRHAGTFGQAGSFSFYFSHHISTIEGGMLITNDPALHDDLTSLRAHGWIRGRSDAADIARTNSGFDERFLFYSMGYNVRPTEIQGALGLVQLGRLEGMLKQREALARDVALWCARSAPWLELIGSEMLATPTAGSDRRHSWMTLPFRLRGDAPLARDEVVRRLEMQGVETRPIIAGNLARHPAVQRLKVRTPVAMSCADHLFANGFMIGCHPVIVPGAGETLERAIGLLAEVGL